MCKHCRLDKYGEVEEAYVSFKEKRLRLGRAIIGVEQLWCNMEHIDGKWTLNWGHGIGDSKYENWNDTDASVRIKYCPFCGEKLT